MKILNSNNKDGNITIQKEVQAVKNLEAFMVSYNKLERIKSDATVAIYNIFKISLLLSDGLAAVINNQIINIGKGNVFFTRPEEIYYGKFLYEGTFEYLDFYLPLSFFENFYDGNKLSHFLTDSSKNRINCIKPDFEIQQKIITDARNIILLLESGEKDADTKIFSIMLQIILLCSEMYDKQKETAVYEDIPVYVSKTISYITEHLTEKNFYK